MIGTMKIKIQGLNSGKIINSLIDDGVYLKNLKQKQKSVVFEISESDENRLKVICKKHRKGFEILSKNNFINLIKRLRFYLGFLVSICLIVAFVFSFNLYIFEVNLSVNENKKFDLTNVEMLLKENGVVSGVKKKDLDILKLQNLIVSSNKNIAGCSIIKNGGKLDVIIQPAILKENVSKENVYSKYNAVITGVEIFAGKTNLKVGDLVKTGDLLIENDNGASGKITGKIYYSDYLIYNENQVVKEFTGRIIEKSSFELINKMLGKMHKINDFSNYIEEKCVFCVSKNNFIPLNFVKFIYREFEYKETKVAFDLVEEELKENIYNTVFEKIDDTQKEKITNVTYSIVTENNLTRLDCFVECEIDLI